MRKPPAEPAVFESPPPAAVALPVNISTYYSNHQKSAKVDISGITESEDENMLHNEARELLVQGYEGTHDAKGIAVERAIAAMGYTLKKKSLYANERVRCAGKTQRMERNHKT